MHGAEHWLLAQHWKMLAYFTVIVIPPVSPLHTPTVNKLESKFWVNHLLVCLRCIMMCVCVCEGFEHPGVPWQFHTKVGKLYTVTHLWNSCNMRGPCSFVGWPTNTHPGLLITNSRLTWEKSNHSFLYVTGWKSLTTSSRQLLPTDSYPISHLPPLLILIFSYLAKKKCFHLSPGITFLFCSHSNHTIKLQKYCQDSLGLLFSVVFITSDIDPGIQMCFVVLLSVSRCNVS